MRVKIEILKEDGVEGDASIETHHKRGETFNVYRADTVMSGDTQTFLVPPDGRIVINAPRATEKPIYDRDQGAAVYPSLQRQGGEGADRPNLAELVKVKEADLAQAKQAVEDDKRRQAEEAERVAAQFKPQQGGKPLDASTPNTATTINKTTTQTAPVGGQPVAGKSPGPTTADLSKAPNPSPGAQPSTPASTHSSGGNTEKK